MLTELAIGVVVGILCGTMTDELLRGRDPRSTRVILWGLFGGLLGTALRRLGDQQGLTLIGLSGAVAALLMAFGSRARVSARLDRLRPLAA